MKSLKKIPLNFFLNNSLVVAEKLVGSVIKTKINGQITSGIITETEAYPGWDGASHAFGERVTPRTKIQYDKGGKLYLYLIMGRYIMTSIVINKKGVADVVFIRSIEPSEGIEIMKTRRKYFENDLRKLASGPGKLTEALGISLKDNNSIVNSNKSTVELYFDTNFVAKDTTKGKRLNLGVDKLTKVQALKAVNRRWRFFIKGSKFLS